MGATKTEAFTTHQNQLAQLAKALGHPARIAILEHLIKVNACVCGELVDVLPLAQPTISQHLKELKTAGIIKGTVEGTAICYCIDPAAIQMLQSFITQFYPSSISLTNTQTCC